MWISSLFQTNIRKLYILGLVSTLAACGGGGGGGGEKPTSQVSTSAATINSSAPASSSLSSLNTSIALTSSSISSQDDSSTANSSASSVFVADTTPDSFSFPAVTGAALGANVTSTAITISGINTAVPISITNGEYSIDGGSFTSAEGTISNGQAVALRLVSAATAATETNATVIIAGVTKSFSVTTANLIGGAVQDAPLNIGGVVTTLAGAVPGADGTGAAAKFNYPAGLVRLGAYLYAADSNNNKIRKIEISTGVVTTLAGSGEWGDADGIGITASFKYPGGVATDGVHLYVADTWNHRIRKIEMTTGMVTTLAGSGSPSSGADGTGAAASFGFPERITSDGTYLFVSDSAHYKIRKIVIATGMVTTLAGSGLSGSADGTGVLASFGYLRGITTDGANLYLADPENNKIRKIVIATGVVTTLAGSGSGGSTDGVGVGASFYYPRDITIDSNHLYVTDEYNNKIRKIEIATGVVTTLAGGGSYGSADGIGVAASFYSPDGITADGADLYVADSGNNKIRKIEIATSAVTSLAGSRSDVDGKDTAASFSSPRAITTDGTYLYIADAYNNKVRKVEVATGVVTTLAGSGESGDVDGVGIAASFDGLGGITTDGTHLYVTDIYNNKVRKIEIATGVVTTLAGSGSATDADGIGRAASFTQPEGITINGTHLYVADTGNHKIRKIDINTSVVTTLAGNSHGKADGTGAAASFYYPQGVTTDGIYLYVADTENNTIRKIEIASAIVTTLAGGDLSNSADGTGAAASFNEPNGITTDGTHLYVADTYHHKIRKIEIATAVVTTLAGSSSAGSQDGVGTGAKFRYPVGITTDGFRLFVTDSGNNTIRKIE